MVHNDCAAYCAVNEYCRRHVPQGVAEATGQHILRVDELHFYWEYGLVLPDGTEAYEVVRRYKSLGAYWTGQCWEFPDGEDAEAFVEEIKAHGGTIGVLDVRATARPLAPGWWLVEAPPAWGLPWLYSSLPLPAEKGRKIASLAVQDGAGGAVVILTSEELCALCEEAKNASAPEMNWPVRAEIVLADGQDGELPSLPAVHPEKAGPWRIVADVSRHPLALRIGVELDLIPLSQRRWGGGAKKVRENGWDGKIMSTVRDWPGVSDKLRRIGIPVEELPMRDSSVELVPDMVPGWSRPAPNGRMLRAYQREAVAFVTEHELRAIIADQMGLGKTVEAIAAAEGSRMEKILVVCPAVARWVWDSEIRSWTNADVASIYHINDTLSPTVPVGARWVIVTYDQIVTRAHVIKCPAGMGTEDFWRAFENGTDIPEKEIQKQKQGPYGGLQKAIKLEAPVRITDADLLGPEICASLVRANRRLAAPLLAELHRWRPDLVVLDEAHKVKNRGAKRSRAVQRLVDGLGVQVEDRHVLLLSGTPLRNNYTEAETLLRILDPTIKERDVKLNKQEVTDYLAAVMIRRRTADVIEQLPDFTRQRWEMDVEKAVIDVVNDEDEIEDINEESTQAQWLMEYFSKMSDARETYSEAYVSAISSGMSEWEAKKAGRQAALPTLSAARHALGMVKALEPALADLIESVVEEHGCVAVFAHHHDVIDTVAMAIQKRNLSIATVDGRANSRDRAEAVARFERGEADVFLGGITVMESLGIPRANVGIFVEFDWVPAVIQQAEARLYRPAAGDKASVHIIQVVARLPESLNLDVQMLDVIDAKLSDIAPVLGGREETSLACDGKAGVIDIILDRLLQKGGGGEGPKTDPSAPWGRKRDGTPRLQKPGFGRPRIDPQLRAAHRKAAKALWRECHLEKQRAYTAAWRQRKKQKAAEGRNG